MKIRTVEDEFFHAADIKLKVAFRIFANAPNNNNNNSSSSSSSNNNTQQQQQQLLNT